MRISRSRESTLSCFMPRLMTGRVLSVLRELGRFTSDQKFLSHFIRTADVRSPLGTLIFLTWTLPTALQEKGIGEKWAKHSPHLSVTTF